KELDSNNYRKLKRIFIGLDENQYARIALDGELSGSPNLNGGELQFELRFLIEFLELYPDGYFSEDILPLFKDCLNNFSFASSLGDLAALNIQHFSKTNIASSKWKKQADQLANQVKNLQPNEQILLPLGYNTPLPYPKYHCLLGLFKRQPNGQFTFVLINTGDGIRFHPARLEQRPGGNVKHQTMCCLEFTNIPKEKLFIGDTHLFFQALIKDSYVAPKAQEKYNIEEFYRGTLGHLEDYFNYNGEYTTAQKNGICAFGATKALFRYLLKDNIEKYKKTRVAMLAFGLKTYTEINSIEGAIEEACRDLVRRAKKKLHLDQPKNQRKWIIQQGYRDLVRRAKKELHKGHLDQEEYDLIMQIALNAKHYYSDSKTSKTIIEELKSININLDKDLVYNILKNGQIKNLADIFTAFKEKALDHQTMLLIKKSIKNFSMNDLSPNQLAFMLKASLCVDQALYDIDFIKKVASIFLDYTKWNFGLKADPDLALSQEDLIKIYDLIDRHLALVPIDCQIKPIIQGNSNCGMTQFLDIKLCNAKGFMKKLISDGIDTPFTEQHDHSQCRLFSLENHYPALDFWKIYAVATSGYSNGKKALAFTLRHVVSRINTHGDNPTNFTPSQIQFLLALAKLDYATVKKALKPIDFYKQHPDLSVTECNRKWLEHMKSFLEKVQRDN
ncbi:MAG: hypothetical protein AAF443_03965, partial [Chlamydiota bacterium]